jgi:hypothetical protein
MWSGVLLARYFSYCASFSPLLPHVTDVVFNLPFRKCHSTTFEASIHAQVVAAALVHNRPTTDHDRPRQTTTDHDAPRHITIAKSIATASGRAKAHEAKFPLSSFLLSAFSRWQPAPQLHCKSLQRTCSWHLISQLLRTNTDICTFHKSHCRSILPRVGMQ